MGSGLPGQASASGNDLPSVMQLLAYQGGEIRDRINGKRPYADPESLIAPERAMNIAATCTSRRLVSFPFSSREIVV